MILVQGTLAFITTIAHVIHCSDIKVILVAEVFKHGAAVAYSQLSTGDPVSDKSAANQALPNGMRQQYVLGKLIYEEYRDLFNEPLNISQIKMTSSSPNFCIESAQSHLLGMLAEVDSPKVTLGPENADLMYPPISPLTADVNFTSQYPLVLKESYFSMLPITVYGSLRDFLFFPQIDIQCPHVREENDYYYTQFLISNQKIFADFYLTLENNGVRSKTYFGKEKWEPILVSNLFKYVETYKATFGTLPSEFTKELYFECRMIHMIYYLNHYFPNPDGAKVFVTNLMKNVLESFEKAQKGELIYSGFSAQDHTMIALLTALKVLSPQCYLNYYRKKMFYFSDSQCVKDPEFSSNIIFELSNSTQASTKPSDDTLLVSILYDGKPLQLSYCNMKTYCTLSEFKRLVRTQLTVRSIEDKCGLGNHIESSYYWIIIGILLLSSAIVMFFTIRDRCLHLMKIKKKVHEVESVRCSIC